MRYLRVRASDREAALPQVAAPDSAPSGVLPPPTLLLLRETLFQARHRGRSSICFKHAVKARRIEHAGTLDQREGTD